MADQKPVIVGELNPYGGSDKFALYPSPDGCSGHRLCCLILGMSRRSYLESFERANLCSGKWSVPAARKRAQELVDNHQRLILCGSKVSAAFGVPFLPFVRRSTWLVLPHPSGRNLLWNEPRIFEKARAAVMSLAPELVGVIGSADRAKNQSLPASGDEGHK